MLNVAIAVDVPGEMGSAAPIISASCEAAVGAGRCPTASSLGPASVVAWYAIVRSDDVTGTHLSVELRDRSATGAIIETRQLVYADYDGAKSRWASVGAVIAAFVADRDSTERVPPAPPVAKVEVAAPAPSPAEGPTSRWGLDLMALTGPALDRGAFRWGGALRGFVGLPRAPGLIGAVSLRYAQRAGDLDLSWVSGSAGIGARLGDAASRFNFDVTGELVYERLSVTGRSAQTGHADSAQENRFGGRLGARAAVRAWAAGLAFVLGVDVSALRPAVAIELADVREGADRALGYTLAAGVRFTR
jgi:hypothetical protein